jgi:hypothetical protein
MDPRVNGIHDIRKTHCRRIIRRSDNTERPKAEPNADYCPIPECLNATRKERRRAEIRPSQSCAYRILYERIKVQVCVAIPIWHHGIVWVDCDCVHHHAWVVAREVVKSVHRFAEVDWLVHHHGVVHPSCLRKC